MTSTTTAPALAEPPGPRGKPLFGNVFDFKRDAVSALVAGWKQYGDFVRYRGVGPFFPVYVLAHPDHVQHVLQDNFRNYRRPELAVKRLRKIVGNGLVTTEGDLWTRQRKTTQTAFHSDRLRPLAPVMTDATAEVLEHWQGNAEREEPIEVQSQMMQLVLAILTRSLFGLDMTRDAPAIEHAVEVQAKWLNDRLAFPVDIPDWAPIPSERRFHEARRVLKRLVDDVVAERRRSGAEGDDLLSVLVNVQDEEDRPISEEQAGDELKTLLIAGHETTAITLAWTFYLLSLHPDATAKLEAEVDEVLGGRTPTAEDVPKLEYTTKVLYESLRLYPPLWIVPRSPIEDDVIGGYPVKAGTTMFLSGFLTHRHPDFWDNPEGFEPERHTREAMKERHRFSYYPFAGGPRGCIGFPFAIMEMPLVLAQIAQRYRLELVPGYPVVPEAATSLRQKDGALMFVRPR